MTFFEIKFASLGITKARIFRQQASAPSEAGLENAFFFVLRLPRHVLRDLKFWGL